MPTAAPLSPTPRTTLTRSRERAATDRAELVDVLRETLVAHLGVTVGEGADAHPVVLPVAIAVDLDGPDDGGSCTGRWPPAGLPRSVTGPSA